MFLNDLLSLNPMAYNTFTILCPSNKCGRCRRLIGKLEALIEKENLDADIQVVSELKQMLKYRTWILPTLVLNDKVIARGYFPGEQKIMEELHE